ncbi:MAG: DUF4293 family protein [Bacteroidetes bacterium]|nr:MAG: DUF4293 family protein [Bacteroidota bacterium]
METEENAPFLSFLNTYICPFKIKKKLRTMIQRIQTIFLIVAAAAALTLFVFPFANTSQSIPDSYFADQDFDVFDHISLIIAFALAGALTLVSIFLYKNRPLQIKLVWGGVLANIAGLVFAILLFRDAKMHLDKVQISENIGAFLPAVFVIAGLLAIRYIRKDEEIVRSADRLR